MFSRESVYTPRLQCGDPSKKILYLDIETTGLSKRNALVYLIGCAFFDANGTHRIRQWFAENPDEEQAILAEFSQFADDYPIICTYNGTGFDLPFLSFRYAFHGISDPCTKKESRDLYRLLAPCGNLLDIPDRKQRTLEEFLSLPRNDRYTGKDCVGIYRELIKYRDIGRAEQLLLHNLEDLWGLLEIESMTAYLSVPEGSFTLESAELSGKALAGALRLNRPVPREISLRSPRLSLTVSGDRMRAWIPLEDGLLKNYYANYRDYYYLPAEDTAVHKSVGGYVARNRRQSATKETCYTKFRPEEPFLTNKRQLERYFQNNIPILLSL